MISHSNRFPKFENSTTVALFILIFTLLPFLFLCAYNVPLGDDFWYANAFRKTGMIETQIFWYKEWSGRYMATFLISTLNPLSYGHLNLGFLHPLVLLVGTVFSFKFLIDALIDFFALQLSRILTLSILLFFYLNYLPDIGETFYWIAAAYTYQVPVIFLFLYFGSLIKFFKSESSVWRSIFNFTLAAFCLFVIIGSNEVIVVYICCFNTLVAGFLFFTDKKNLLKFLPLLITTIVLSYVMIFAEGNFSRASLFAKPSFHFLKATLQSTFRGIFVLVFWIPTLMLLLLAIPGVSKIDFSENLLPVNIRKNNLLLILSGAVLILLIVFIGFFPSIYTTNWIPQRAYTPIFAVFLVAFILIFVAFMRFFPILVQVNETLSGLFKTSGLFLTILVITLSYNSNVMNAYVDLTSGKASSYHNQVISTYKGLVKNTSDTIFVNDLMKRPLILPIRWPQKHNRLANDIWEEYFNIKRVELE